MIFAPLYVYNTSIIILYTIARWMLNVDDDVDGVAMRWVRDNTASGKEKKEKTVCTVLLLSYSINIYSSYKSQRIK